MSWIWIKHIWSRRVTPHWVCGGGFSLYLSLTHSSSLMLSFISLHVVNTFRPQTQLTSHLLPPRGPEPLAHRHSTSKLISGLVQMIKQYASEVLALLTRVMRLTAAHSDTGMGNEDSGRVCVCTCVFATLPKTWLDTFITVKHDSLTPSGQSARSVFTIAINKPLRIPSNPHMR